MNLKMTLFAIFAIFCVLGSACAISPADDSGNGGYMAASPDDGNGVDDSNNGNNYLGNSNSDSGVGQAAGDGSDGWSYPGDVEPGNGLPLENQTNPNNTTGNATHAAGELVNGTAHGNSNVTANATSSGKLPATGNPLVVLVLAIASIGGAAVIKNKK